MSSAHIFYLPIMLALGVAIGYYVGRRAAENDAMLAKKRLARRNAMAQKMANNPDDAQDS